MDFALGPSQEMLRSSLRAVLASGNPPPDTSGYAPLNAVIVAAEVGRAAFADPPADPLLASADAWGAASAALEVAVAHTCERVQFGQPLAAFQAVAHHAANMAIACDSVWLTVLEAVSTIERGEPADRALADAVVLTIERLPFVADTAHQIVGAAGLYLDHPLHRWTRRILTTSAALGPIENWLDL